MAAKKEKVTVEMGSFKKMQRLRSLINSTPLENLKFYDGAKRMKVTQKMRDDWQFTGLNNVDFIQLVLLGEGWINI